MQPCLRTVPSRISASDFGLRAAVGLSVPARCCACRTGAHTCSATLAKQLQQYLPGFTYNLTAEAPTIRAGICAQQVSYCSISGCANAGATVSTNFCNNQTMGCVRSAATACSPLRWDCECSSGASRLLDWQSPVNQVRAICPIDHADIAWADCRFRQSACNTASVAGRCHLSTDAYEMPESFRDAAGPEHQPMSGSLLRQHRLLVRHGGPDQHQLQGQLAERSAWVRRQHLGRRRGHGGSSSHRRGGDLSAGAFGHCPAIARLSERVRHFRQLCCLVCPCRCTTRSALSSLESASDRGSVPHT